MQYMILSWKTHYHILYRTYIHFWLNSSPPRIIIKDKRSQTCLSNAKPILSHKPLLSITDKSFWNVNWNLKSISRCHLHDGSSLFQKPLLIKPIDVLSTGSSDINVKQWVLWNSFANFNALCMKPQNKLPGCHCILKVTLLAVLQIFSHKQLN